MNIYKFTHMGSFRSYIDQTIQRPDHRRIDHIADSKITRSFGLTPLYYY
jgi:hypothetical protein